MEIIELSVPRRLLPGGSATRPGGPGQCLTHVRTTPQLPRPGGGHAQDEAEILEVLLPTGAARRAPCLPIVWPLSLPVAFNVSL